MSKRKRIASSKRRQKRQSLRVLYIITAVIILGLLLWLIWFFFHWQALMIREIKVRGTQVISSENIYQTTDSYLSGSYASFFPFRHVLIFPSNSLALHIANTDSRIEDVEVERSGWRGIEISISEYEPAIIVCDSEKKSCFYGSNEGYIFQKAPVLSDTSLITLYKDEIKEDLIGNNVVDQEVFSKVLTFFKDLQEIPLKPSHIKIVDDFSFEIWTNGPRILLHQRTLDEAFERLLIIISDLGTNISKEDILKMDYIDLRYDKKVFYKFSEKND